MVSKYAIRISNGPQPAILMLSPPLDMRQNGFAPHTAYSMAKFGMSLVVLGLSGELKPKGTPSTPCAHTIPTAASQPAGRRRLVRRSARPDIVADAAHTVFAKPAKSFSGNFLMTTVPGGRGCQRFRPYRVDPTSRCSPISFVPDDSRARGVSLAPRGGA